MKRKRSVRIKKENLSLIWDGLVLQNGKQTIDLGTLSHVSQPLIGEVREFLSLRHNNTWRNMHATLRAWQVFNTWLTEHEYQVRSYNDFDQKTFTVFLAHCRGLQGAEGQKAFQTLRRFYEFGGDLLKDGVLQDTLAMVKKVHFKAHDYSKYIKTMDPQKGPLLRCELEAMRHRLGEWMLSWNDMDTVTKTVALAYALNDETTRRFDELSKLNIDDIYKTPEGVFVRFGPRKSKSEGSDSQKVGHAISDWLFPFFEEYKKCTARIRNLLHTKRLFVWESQRGNFAVRGDAILQAIKRIFQKHPIPSRRFFASDHDIAELEINKELRLNFTSGRIRDTFGTHMTLLGVDKDLIATRMGHKSMLSQRRYRVVTHPDFASQVLSITSGSFYSSQSDYFMNAPVAAVSSTEAVRDLEDPNGAVFGGCRNRCACNPVLACYSCPRYIPLVPSREHARNLLKIEAEGKRYEQLILNAGGIADIRVKSDFEKAKAICARCADLSTQKEI